MPELVVERYASAQRFLDETGPWLGANEPANNLVLSLGHTLAGDDHPFVEPIFLAAIKQRGRVVGCAVRPPPDHLDLTPMPPGAATLVATSAVEHCPGLETVGGEENVAAEFARAWVRLRGGSWRIGHRWSWLVLHEVNGPRTAPGGQLRLAEPDDRPLIAEWASLYVLDTGATGDVLKFLERRLATRSLFIWDHDGPKAMAAISGYTPKGLRVSAVFTPGEHRRRGYASNAVATISQRALDGGRDHCVLFAESHHTHTLRVYRNVGYRPSHSTVVIELSIA
jgi:predicted GNAT family acetyltransferase